MLTIPDHTQQLSQEIRKLKKTDAAAYFDRYFTELFPQVYELVQQRMVSEKYCEIYQKLHKQYDGLIQTVGDSPEPLVLSIMLLRPKEVLLIHTPETRTAADRILYEAHNKLGKEAPSPNKREVDSSNPLEVYQAVKDQWERWNSEGKTVAIDVTGGKKSMVSGASLAVGFLDVDIVYVDNEGYDSGDRRPVDGAEFLNRLPNPMQVFGEFDQRKAIELFNAGNYSSAAAMFKQLAHAIPLDDAGYESYYLLADTYDAWDNLEIAHAFEQISRLCTKLETYAKYGNYPLTDHLNALRRQRNILERVARIFQESQAANFHGITLLEGEEGFQNVLTLIFSFHSNANRRERQQKCDMGALLLYRVLEMAEQRRLAEYGLDTAHPDFSEERLEALRDQLPNRAIKTLRRYAQDSRPSTFRRIPLSAGYMLLNKLDDPIMQAVDMTQLQDQVLSRNLSMFAHGFQAITAEEYRKFKQYVENVLRTFCEIEGQNMQDLTSQYEFIQPFRERAA
jgi:CRISPR-associated protein (TIGR02710 family)